MKMYARITRLFSRRESAPQPPADEFALPLAGVLDVIADGVAILEIVPGAPFPLFRYVNAATAQRTGYARETLLLDPATFFSGEINRALAARLVKYALADEAAPDEVQIARSDGSAYWVRMTCRRLASVDGRIFLLLLTSDLSERKESEQYRQLLAACVEQESDAIAIFRVDRDRPMEREAIYVNQAFVELSGYSREDIARDPRVSLLGPNTDLELTAQHVAMLGRGENFASVNQFHRRDGTSFWAEVRGRPLADVAVSDRYYWVFAFRDITQQRAEEARSHLLTRALNQANDFFIIADGTPPSKGGPFIRYVNRAFLGTTGWEAHEIIGKSMAFAVSKHTPEAAIRSIIENTEHERKSQKEVLLRRKGASPFWVEFVGQPLRDEDGAVTHWLAVGRDISQRKQAQVQLALLASALEAAETAVTMHELNRDGTLACVYENERAVALASDALPQLFTDPHARDALLRTESVHRWIRARTDAGESWIDVRADALRDADGRVASFVTIERPMLRFQKHTKLPSLAQRLDALHLAIDALAHAPGEADRIDVLTRTLATFFDATIDFIEPATCEPPGLHVGKRQATFLLPSTHQCVRVSWKAPLEGLDLTLLRALVEAFLAASTV